MIISINNSIIISSSDENFKFDFKNFKILIVCQIRKKLSDFLFLIKIFFNHTRNMIKWFLSAEKSTNKQFFFFLSKTTFHIHTHILFTQPKFFFRFKTLIDCLIDLVWFVSLSFCPACDKQQLVFHIKFQVCQYKSSSSSWR